MIRLIPITILAATLAACSSSGSTPADDAPDNLGACSRAVTDHVFLNGPDDFDPDDDFSVGDGSGNKFILFVGVENGVFESSTFNWGPDYDGCEITM